MTEYDSINDVELTNEHIRFLSKAGASDDFIDLLTFLPPSTTVKRHSVREEIQKYVYWGSLNIEKDPATFSHCGGHFFTALWNGDLFEAWGRADFNNKALLIKCFGKDAIVENAIQSGRQIDYARRMVTEPAL